MPRKKTTPTVATTEPDTTLNPDRAQVAEVADLPLSAADLIRASLPRDTPPEEVVRVAHFYDELKAAGETMPILTGKTFRSVEDLTLYLSQTDRPEVADLPREPEPVVDTIPEIPPGSGGPTLESVLAEKDATIDEQDARIAYLEAELGEVLAEVATSPMNDDPLRAYLRALTYPASVAENLEMARDRLTDEDRALVHSLTEDEVGLRDYLRVAAHPDVTPATIDAHYRRLSQADSEVVTRYCVAIAADAIRTYAESHAPTPHDHAAGYLAITSGNVRAARWKRNILHDIRDPDMVIGQIDHLTDGWAPSVKGAAAPPMKTEAEARAWCEARCGWTVVQ